MEFRGVFASITTPFDHLGEIYWAKVRHNLGRLERTTLSGYVVGDRWGEGLLLSSAETVRLWKEVVSQAAEKRSVLAAISNRGVNEGRALCSEAAAVGCQAVLIQAPDVSEMAPFADSAALFFRSVADAASLPVVIDVALGGADGLTVAEIVALAAHPRISGALVSSDDPVGVNALTQEVGAQFAVMVRGVKLMEPCLSAGARAVVTAVASAVPFYCLSIEEAIRTRELEAARELSATAMEFEGVLNKYGVPALKHALDLRGCYGGIPRLPLLRLPSEIEGSVEASILELAS